MPTTHWASRPTAHRCLCWSGLYPGPALVQGEPDVCALGFRHGLCRTFLQSTNKNSPLDQGAAQDQNPESDRKRYCGFRLRLRYKTCDSLMLNPLLQPYLDQRLIGHVTRGVGEAAAKWCWSWVSDWAGRHAGLSASRHSLRCRGFPRTFALRPPKQRPERFLRHLLIAFAPYSGHTMLCGIGLQSNRHGA